MLLPPERFCFEHEGRLQAEGQTLAEGWSLEVVTRGLSVWVSA